MFYFSHPLSCSPASSSFVDNSAVFGNNNATSNYNSTTTEMPEVEVDEEQSGHANETDRIRLASFIPSSQSYWAHETEFAGSSMIAPMTHRNGKLSPPNYHLLLKHW